MDTFKKRKWKKLGKHIVQFTEFYKNWNAARMQKLRYCDSLERRPAGAIMFHVDRRLMAILQKSCERAYKESLANKSII
jgi:hypothetical protein